MAIKSRDDRNSSAWQWLASGWQALRDKAVSAMTHFSPSTEEEHDAQRWGVLATDITERRKSIHVELEIPGMDKADLRVEVHDDQLLIAGEKRSSETRREGAIVVTERAFGSFQRVLTLPCAGDAAGTRARYTDGVLMVDIPKANAPGSRSIPVRHN